MEPGRAEGIRAEISRLKDLQAANAKRVAAAEGCSIEDLTKLGSTRLNDILRGRLLDELITKRIRQLTKEVAS